MPKLELRNLVKHYGQATAVDTVNLSIGEGEFVSLLGPSGCGKTTTLRMIAGFIRPTDGIIMMGDRELSSPRTSLPPEKRGMSMIFQSYAIWPNMTVAENVGFGLKLRKLPTQEIERKTMEILEVTQMAHLAKRYPAELSGGQQQRVALARAIVVRPEVLLLDEPLSNLDANLREEMRFEIRRLHDEFRITTVYVTHDQGEAMVASDRIAVMNKGKIEQVDTPYQVYNKPASRFVAGFIGRTNLIKANVTPNGIDLGGVMVDRKYFEADVLTRSGEVEFSVRPQTVTIHRKEHRPADGSDIVLEAVIDERAYLGDTWDYVIKPEGSDRKLRVNALPKELYDVGAKVWLSIDASQIVALNTAD